MLNAADLRTTARRRRAPYSDKQHYHEYILQRVEGYKNSIGRDELLRVATRPPPSSPPPRKASSSSPKS
jgi:hypothetical protein